MSAIANYNGSDIFDITLESGEVVKMSTGDIENIVSLSKDLRIKECNSLLVGEDKNEEC